MDRAGSCNAVLLSTLPAEHNHPPSRSHQMHPRLGRHHCQHHRHPLPPHPRCPPRFAASWRLRPPPCAGSAAAGSAERNDQVRQLRVKGDAQLYGKKSKESRSKHTRKVSPCFVTCPTASPRRPHRGRLLRPRCCRCLVAAAARQVHNLILGFCTVGVKLHSSQ